MNTCLRFLGLPAPEILFVLDKNFRYSVHFINFLVSYFFHLRTELRLPLDYVEKTIEIDNR